MSQTRASARSVRCPDCAAPLIGQFMAHFETCPLGRAIDLVVANDAAWFAADLDRRERTRVVTAAEQADVWFSVGLEVSGWVTVTRLAPGVRTRRFHCLDGV